ncbi:hybrid sensor histidine kinase/response regulator transcription factor [Chondrinema litorale]|uniref:hybrid sensor histidine kinase/response regulator transcription factor n=1 Tax=Chondrinema litorale TaxID=2994555 RepID=UPI0025439B69|nr:two-component regulator propeller domain-containing protein [Chondrinema litorale]UZR99441.1 response regulator [Chondrinema litorale]
MNTSDGLSQNNILDIQEDYVGFIWLATGDGLNRYDGTSFKVYRKELNTGIDFFNVNEVHESADSTLWIGTKNGGLCKYNRKEDSFQQYIDRDGYSLSRKSVNTIADDGKGNLIISYETGKLVLLDLEKNIFYWDFLKSLTDKYEIEALTVDRAGNLWLGANEGKIIHAVYDNSSQYYQIKKECNTTGRIRNLQFGDSVIWIASDEGVLSLNVASEELNNLPDLNYRLETVSISDVLTDQQGYCWIGTSILGLYRYDPKTGELLDFKERGKSQRIVGNGITSIYCDKNNNIWIGTYASGVNLFSRERHLFKEYMLIDGNTNPFKGSNVPCFALSDSKNIWMANGGELSLLKTGKAYHYIETEKDSFQILNQKVNHFYEDKAGNYWIGTRKHGLKYYRKGEGFIQIEQLKNIFVNDMLETSDNRFFIAHNKGIKEITTDLKVKEIANNHPEIQTYVISIAQDVNGDLLIGTNNRGLFRYNETQDTLMKIGGEEISEPLNVSDILIDQQERIWVGSFGAGLLLYNRKEHLLKRVEFDILPPSDIVKSIEEDNAGRIWFSTNKGISMYEPETKQLFNYTTDDGLQGDEFIINASLKDADGNLLFGGFDGFNYFDPLAFQEQKTENDVLVSGINFLNENNQKAKIQHDQNGIIKSAKLPYFLNDFTISLASRYFAYKEQPEFWYKLSGYKEDWVHVKGANTITFTNLDPGNYQLIVDPSKLPTENTQLEILQIEINPPVWQTVYAYLAYTAILIFLVILFRRKTLANEKLKADLRIKELDAKKIIELNKLKSSFFTNVSHEFRTPITLLLGPLESLMKSTRTNEKLFFKYKLMHKNAKVLLRLINQILDTSKIEFGFMPLQVSKGNIISHIRDIYSSFEFLADTHQIKYTFECNFHNLQAYFDKDKVEKITYNLLSNAFKFTKDGGEISVILNLIPSKERRGYTDRLIMTVGDNGIGISKENLELIFSSFYQGEQLPRREHIGSGIGLSLTKQLVSLHQGKISVESEYGKGSLFSVELPLNKESYPDFIDDNYKESPDRQLNLEFEDELEAISLTSNPTNQTYENYDQVLIIDDNSDILDYLNIELGNKYRIYQATDGKSGLDMAIRNIPDLIITDVMMPGLNGYELCEKLKKDPRTNHIPVIIITALSESKDKIKGLEIGADDYITKPFNMAILQQRIGNIITNRTKLKKHYDVKETLPNKIHFEDAFIQQVADKILEHIQEENLTVESLASMFNISSMQLYRKIRGALNLSPNEFIRFIRLNCAANILRNHKEKNIAEVAYEVGFKDPSYFSRCFKKQFELSPKDFVNELFL